MIDRRRFLANGGIVPSIETGPQCHQDDRFSFEELWAEIAHNQLKDPPLL